MIPVGGDKGIIRLGGSHTSCRNRFLPDISVEKAADLTLHFVFFFRHQLELTNELH
jgi:hypothetical protein